MTYSIDRLATPGSQYGYTGNPADQPFDMTGFRQQPASPMEAFQRWYSSQNGGPNNQPALGSGMFATATNPAYRPDNIDVGGGFNPAGPGGGGSPTSGIGQYLRDIGALGTRDQQGWGGLALGAAQGLGSLYMGMQQYNLAKESLASSKDQFERNYAAQKSEINTNLEDRQRARVAANSGAYQSVGDYMAKNGIK